jgi:hypothetical protein
MWIFPGTANLIAAPKQPFLLSSGLRMLHWRLPIFRRRRVFVAEELMTVPQRDLSIVRQMPPKTPTDRFRVRP